MERFYVWGYVEAVLIVFNIIYIMRINVIMAKLLCPSGLLSSPSRDSDDGSCSGVFHFG